MSNLWSRGQIQMLTGTLFVLALLTPTANAQTGDPVLVAAGDISGCTSGIDEKTAALLDGIEGTVAVLGDLVGQRSTAADFNNCYEPSWGRHKSRTYPAAGNHEYAEPNATPYFDYFGDRAGPRGKGYYSYNLGAWHIVVLNNYVDMKIGSEQERWLRADLANNPARCTLAYWHEPRWTSGTGHADAVETGPLWQALYDYGADVVLNGHEHHYERFAPQNPAGQLDNARGIRQFIVGTGGMGVYGFGTPKPNSEVRNGTTYGVLQLTLHADSYDYRFVPIAEQRFTDYGRTTCSPLVTGTPAPAPSPTPTPSPQRIFSVEADARLVESAPTTNYGTTNLLRVNGGSEPDERSVLRVSVSGITQPIASAKMRLYALSPTTVGPSMYRVTNSWTETGVTWNIRPPLEGATLTSVRSVSANRWVEYDVTAAVTGNGTYSFALVGTSTDGVDFSSRQGSYAPRLVVTLR